MADRTTERPATIQVPKPTGPLPATAASGAVSGAVPGISGPDGRDLVIQALQDAVARLETQMRDQAAGPRASPVAPVLGEATPFDLRDVIGSDGPHKKYWEVSMSEPDTGHKARIRLTTFRVEMPDRPPAAFPEHLRKLMQSPAEYPATQVFAEVAEESDSLPEACWRRYAAEKKLDPVADRGWFWVNGALGRYVDRLYILAASRGEALETFRRFCCIRSTNNVMAAKVLEERAA